MAAVVEVLSVHMRQMVVPEAERLVTRLGRLVETAWLVKGTTVVILRTEARQMT